jgi:hypothetical protein
MKTKALMLCTLGLAVLWTGCWQKSVQPFYKAGDVIFETPLLGTWQDSDKKPEDSTIWTFARGEKEKTYRLEIKDTDNKYNFDVHLFNIGTNRFLDLYSRNRSVSDIPGHSLLRVGRIGSTMEVRVLSIKWVKDWLKAHPNEIAHIEAADPDHPNDPDQGETILTADTDRLQKFVIAHLDAEGFFDGSGELKKIEAK